MSPHNDVYQKVLNSLKADGVVLEQLLPNSEASKFCPEKIIHILDSSYNLIYDEEKDELRFINKDGSEEIAPDLSAGVTLSSTWLCDKLPVPVLDFDQGGKIRQQDEAKSIYKLICIGIVFSSFKAEIKNTFKHYDFVNFKFDKDFSDYDSMTEYLRSFVELGSIRINVVVSSANIQISNTVEKKDSYWKSQLTLEEITEFAKVSRDVKNVILMYERESKLNPEEMGKLSRVEKLKRIDQRDVAVDAIINASECSTLYRISKLNSERLTATTKRKMFTAANKVARAVVKDEMLSDRDADERFSSLFSFHYREFSRMAVTTLRTNELIRYKSDRAGYKFIKKV